MDREWNAAVLGSLARTTGREAFIRHFPHPFLLVQVEPNDAVSPETDVRAFDAKPVTLASFTSETRYVALVGDPTSAYPGKLWVGRTLNCDIVVSDPSISKLHACFYVGTDVTTWALSDMQSANGTFLNGRKLPPQEPTRLRPGDRLQFGGVQGLFIDAAMLYDHRRSQLPQREPCGR